MRPLLGVFALLALMTLTTTALGHEVSGSYEDEFNTVSYSDSDGTIDWTPNPWGEIGESNGASAGKVRVESSGNCFGSNCLVFKSGLIGVIGAQRFANLDGWENAGLHYDVSSNKLLGPLPSAATMNVEVTDGSGWDIVDTYSLGDSPGHRSENVSDWISAGFSVRFQVVGLVSAEVYVDNVEIRGTIGHEEPTATTTTAPTPTITVPPAITVPTTPTTVLTTTTAAPPTTTTESKDVPGSPTTTEPTRPDEAVGETTTTLGIETTTTTTSEELALKPGRTPPSSGPRQAATGIQTGYQTGLFGSFGVNQPEVLGVELSADLRTAVEVIRASWIWMLALAAVVATLIVTGLDHRGPSKGTATTFGS